MANKEILLVVEVFSNEKEIDKEIVFQAIESALEKATIKRHVNQVKARRQNPLARWPAAGDRQRSAHSGCGRSQDCRPADV